MNRKKLLEVLNRVKAENSSTSEAGSSAPLNPVNESFPRGAGRARLFRPELFNKLTLNPSEVDSSAANSLNNVHSTPTSAEPEETKKVDKAGTKGKEITLTVNYISIKCKPNTSIHVYEVRFEPNIHSNKLRRGILASALKQRQPIFTFDGTTLFLPQKDAEDNITLRAKNDKDNGSTVIVTLIYKHEKSMRECIQFYNLLFKQVLTKLEYVQFGRSMFDPKEPKIIPHRQLTIWPGYVLSCDEFDGGLKLVVDTSHRVLFNTKVSDLLLRIAASCSQHPTQNFKDLVQKSLLGAVVLTPYNNKTYTIHDIDFEQTPLSTFKTKDGEKSYVEYYKTNYGLDIHDLQQPMLISYKDRKMIAQNGQSQKDRLTISLLPELTQLTGLTDEMRSDKIAMRDIASYIRLTPNQRVQAARKFIAKVNDNPSARAILDNWGLSLNDDLLELQGRQLPPESITFGGGKTVNGITGDFGQHFNGNTLFEVIDLENWIVFYTKQDTNIKQEFLEQVRRCAGPMGLNVRDPHVHMLNDDRTDTYARILRTILKADTQMAVFICPTSRDDRYSVIKKICCAESPIPSQVINSRTLANREKNRSIVQKILMQMNCKLGGSLWTIRIPFQKVMICGMDTYHSPNKDASVAALVASLNATYTKWYSKATMQSNHEELGHGLAISMGDALNTYKRHNGFYPDRIIFYRDGVGDGQLKICKEFELPQIKKACRLLDDQYNPTVTFIVVRKRVHTRIFKESTNKKNYYENPPAGTVIDHSITRRGFFDFYLVSQNMRHGTATPCHFVVIENECELSPDVLQQLSYKLTYQYFNWPGSIRVPAPCQYAHKLAYLVGESIKRETAAELNDKLFYL